MKITKQEVQDMIHAAKLNRERLESCSRHFYLVLGVLQQHVVCANCHGRVQTGTAYAYAAGYVHAGGKMADVLVEDY